MELRDGILECRSGMDVRVLGIENWDGGQGWNSG